MKLDKTVVYIKEMLERNRWEISSLPRSINPQNVPECIDVVLKFLNSIIRSRLVIELCNIAEKFDIPPRDKLQIEYYKEVIKEHILGLYNSVSKLVETILSYYPEDSFEHQAFSELESIIKSYVREFLPGEEKGGEGEETSEQEEQTATTEETSS